MESFEQKYALNKNQIKARLQQFKELPEQEYFKELLFCILTPQSNAKKCWQAVEQISLLEKPTKNSIKSILKDKTRFHNNKSNYIIEAYSVFQNIRSQLNNKNRIELRNKISDEIKGIGMKEASHFLRNIGKSDNQIAILDRHILRNLKSLNIIETDKIKNKSHYLEIEKKFIEFSKNSNIPLDELDLLFWSNETGEIFK